MCFGLLLNVFEHEERLMNEFYNKMKYFEDTEGIQEETYYHYTTLEALYNIVKNKTFWLTSLKSSNDKKNCIIKHQIFL